MQPNPHLAAIITIHVNHVLSTLTAGSTILANSAEANTHKSTATTSHPAIFKLGPSPININSLASHLQGYHDSDFLFVGFTSGFRLQYLGPRGGRESHNLKSIKQNITIASEKISKEVRLHRVAGPFKIPPLVNLQVSPLGLVPKKMVICALYTIFPTLKITRSTLLSTLGPVQLPIPVLTKLLV